MVRKPEEKDPKRIAAATALLSLFICLGRAMRLSVDAMKPTGFDELWPSLLAFYVEYGDQLRADAQKVKGRFKNLTLAEKGAVCEFLTTAFNMPPTVLQAELDTAIGNAINFFVSMMNIMGYVDQKYDRSMNLIAAKATKVPDPTRLMVMDKTTVDGLVAAGALIAKTKAAEPEA